MIRWIPYSFIRIVFFFSLGICLGIYYPNVLPYRITLLVFLALLGVYGIIVLSGRQEHSFTSLKSSKFLAGIVGLTAIFFAGVLNTLGHTATRDANHLVHLESPIDYYTAVVTSAPVEKTSSWKVEASIQKVNTVGIWKACSANVLLYISKSDFATTLRYGDIVLVKGSPQPIEGPHNPGEFDYRRFLQFQNIHHQHFVRKEQIRRIDFAPPSSVMYYALACRRWAEGIIRTNISGEREQGLAAALILGVKDGLDDDLLSAYKATGSMHVLAVSGLHVGILYGILLLMLKPIRNLKIGPWVIAGISIGVLWAYAFIAGMSPSVLRAVTMFSFAALAKGAGYRTNMYNTLAASAFFILWIDPFMLMTVGFQLSYLAVLGIVYMQSGLYNLWAPDSRVWDEIWKVTCISLAAQFATFSLGLFYFHQFPTYFWLSNLFVIPGAFMVLVLGLLMLAVNFIQPAVSLVGFVLEWCIKGLNIVVFAIEDLPFGLIRNVYITSFQTWLLIFLIVAILLLLHTRKFTWVVVTFSAALIFSAMQWYHFKDDVSIQKITVYNVKGHSAIDLIDHGKVYFIADTTLERDIRKIDFHITPNRIRAGCSTIAAGAQLQKQRAGCTLMVWKGKSILQIYDRKFSIPEGATFDFVIVSHDAVEDLAELHAKVHIKHLILDSSNSQYFINKVLRENEMRRSKIHSVPDDGAFDLTI